MTPKEKAEELVKQYYVLIPRLGDFSKNWQQAKQCALICADEIMVVCLAINYWQEVKQEIDKL